MKTETNLTLWEIPVSDTLFLRLYQDTRPHNQLITNLQKGLILTSGKTELAGEGIGLGVPAVRYKGRTYFSGSSIMKLGQTAGRAVAIKRFSLNLTCERSLRNIHIETERVRIIRRCLDDLYMKHKHLRLLAVESMLRRAGVTREFVQTKPVGCVTVTYKVASPHIGVEAEFRLLQEKGFQRIYLLNEQSSQHFRKYYDSDDIVLHDADIGAWETVEASWACICSVKDNVGFRLWKHEDAVLHRGREFLKGAIDWVGLDYEAGPENACFAYNVELVRS